MSKFRRLRVSGHPIFITLVVAGRRPILPRFISPLREAFRQAQVKWPFDLIAVVVLLDHIHYNPVKHGLVSKAGDWPYSSFHRFVKRGWLMKNWGLMELGSTSDLNLGE